MRKLTSALLSFLFITFFPFYRPSGLTAEFPKFEIVTESLPPYQFKENGHIKGIAVDLLAQMLQRAGSSQGTSDISMISWARGLCFPPTDPGLGYQHPAENFRPIKGRGCS